MNRCFVVLLFLSFAILHASIYSMPDITETDSLETMDLLEAQISDLNKSVNSIQQDFSQAKHGFEIQRKEFQEQNNMMQNSIETLKEMVEQNQERVRNEFVSFEYKLSKRSKYIIICILALVLTFFIFGVLYQVSLKKSKKSFEQKVQNIQTDFHEDNIRLDAKLIELLGKQFDSLVTANALDKVGDVDHSLLLKIADEVIRIKMNLNNMDASIKGHKQISRAASAIIDNFSSNGYEIPDLLNKEYDSGMKMLATMVQDEELAPGSQIIKRIIKPQVNYKGKMIQAAEVVVAFND